MTSNIVPEPRASYMPQKRASMYSWGDKPEIVCARYTRGTE